MILPFSTGFIYIYTLQSLEAAAARLFLRALSSLHIYPQIGPNTTLVADFSYENFMPCI